MKPFVVITTLIIWSAAGPLLASGPGGRFRGVKVTLKDGTVAKGYYGFMDGGWGQELEDIRQCQPANACTTCGCEALPEYAKTFIQQTAPVPEPCDECEDGPFKLWMDYINLRAAKNFEGLTRQAKNRLFLAEIVEAGKPLSRTVAVYDLKHPYLYGDIQNIASEPTLPLIEDVCIPHAPRRLMDKLSKAQPADVLKTTQEASSLVLSYAGREKLQELIEIPMLQTWGPDQSTVRAEFKLNGHPMVLGSDGDLDLQLAAQPTLDADWERRLTSLKGRLSKMDGATKIRRQNALCPAKTDLRALWESQGLFTVDEDPCYD